MSGRLSLGRCLVRSDSCLSYVPGFVAKSESISNSLPRSFLVASLSDFAAGLDDELLLFPVCALRIYSEQDYPFFFSSSSSSFSVPREAFSGFVEECHFFLPTGGIHGTGAARLEVGSVVSHSIRGISTSVAFHKNW